MIPEDPRERIARQDDRLPSSGQLLFWVVLIVVFVFGRGGLGSDYLHHRWGQTWDWISWGIGGVLLVGACWEAFSFIRRRVRRGREPSSATPAE